MAELSHYQALEPLSSVIADIRTWDPCLDSTIERFFDEVEKRARTRGWKSILLLDLPKLGSLYDQGVSTGRLDIQSIPASFGKLVDGRFDSSWIFRTLLQHTFDGHGTFDDTTPVEVIAATRQLLYLYKKTNLACPDEAIHDAVEDYIRIEESTRTPSGTWDNDLWIPWRTSFARDSAELGYLPRSFWELLDLVFGFVTPSRALCPEAIVPRHGPGAVSDLRRTGSEYDKYSFPSWPHKLERLFPSTQFAHANEYVGLCEPIGHSPKESPARLIAVPKTFKGPRLIASEPTSHQFLQQGLMRWIRENLPEALRACVNFHSQDPSRDIALEASRTGDLATVDLSSASDRLSCWVVERAFSSNQTLLAALHATRTRVVVDATGTHDGLSMRMKKFAAQGSSVTFPVQTIIYAAVAITSVLWDDGCRRPSSKGVCEAAKRVRVFGDDIVLPSPNVLTLSAALKALGLKVNGGKTHYKGRFRESCGMDAYSGHDVTPFYVGDLRLKPDPESLTAWLELSNNAHRKGLWRTAEWMLQQIDRKTASNILISDSDGPGMRAFSFCKGTRFHGRTRYNAELHVQERKVLCFSVTADREARGSFQDLHQYFVEDPLPDTKWSAGIPGKNRTKMKVRWVPGA